MSEAVERRDHLVLHRPQHYHVLMVFYEREDEQTKQFMYSTEFDLVSNDVALAVTKAGELSNGKPQHHVAKVTQCSDPDHLKGLTL